MNIGYLVSTRKDKLRYNHIRIVILTPIDVEFHALTAYVSNIEIAEIGDTILHTGNIGTHKIAIATFLGAEYGNTNSGILLSAVCEKFNNIEYVFVVGIAGSIVSTKVVIEGKTDYPRLGDLVVGRQIWRYDLGKLTEQGVDSILPPQKGSLGLAQRAQAFFLNGENEAKWIRAIKEGLEHNNRQNRGSIKKYKWSRPDDIYDILHDINGNELQHSTIHGVIKNSPNYFFEPIAVGDTVLKSAKIRERLADKGYFAVEMESYGALQVKSDKLKVISIRSISDYSDGHKNKEWQPYAAIVACAFVKCFLELFEL